MKRDRLEVVPNVAEAEDLDFMAQMAFAMQQLAVRSRRPFLVYLFGMAQRAAREEAEQARSPKGLVVAELKRH